MTMDLSISLCGAGEGARFLLLGSSRCFTSCSPLLLRPRVTSLLKESAFFTPSFSRGLGGGTEVADEVEAVEPLVMEPITGLRWLLSARIA